jgi:hypothetical protein
MDILTFYKILDVIVNTFIVLGAILAGYLFYSGLSSREERIRSRLKLRQGFQEQKHKFMSKAQHSKEDLQLNQAGNPLGFNGIRYRIVRIIVIVAFTLNYMVLPIIMIEDIKIIAVFVVITLIILTEPKFKYSLYNFLINKLIEFRQSKRNSEIFQLHDLLISEIDMMSNNRVNTYSILKNLHPYFEHIKADLTKLLRNWKNDPDNALEAFANDIGTKEARALASVLMRLDANEREVATEALKSHGELFAKSQIEAYRRRKKLFADLGAIPVRITHFLIILNFICIIVYMVMDILKNSRI